MHNAFLIDIDYSLFLFSLLLYTFLSLLLLSFLLSFFFWTFISCFQILHSFFSSLSWHLPRFHCVFLHQCLYLHFCLSLHLCIFSFNLVYSFLLLFSFTLSSSLPSLWLRWNEWTPSDPASVQEVSWTYFKMISSGWSDEWVAHVCNDKIWYIW